VETLEEQVKLADFNFRKKCAKLGVYPSDLSPYANPLYTTTVSMNIPLTQARLLMAKTEETIDAAMRIAKKYGLRAIYEGLWWSTDGRWLLDVGFKGMELPTD